MNAASDSAWKSWMVEQGRAFFLYWALSLACWLLMYMSFPESSLPASYHGSSTTAYGSGGGIFAFFVLFFAGDAAGRFAKSIGVPPLFGMLIMGLIVQFLPGMKYSNPVAGQPALPALSQSVLNLGVQASFSIVLCRAGMGLDISTLLANKMRVFAITVVPLVFEMLVGLGLSSAPGLLDFKSPFNVLSGFLISCPSPAIAIPALLSLKELGIDVDPALKSLILGAVALNTVLTLAIYPMIIAIGIPDPNSSPNPLITVAILQIVFGILLGFVIAKLFWFIVNVCHESAREKFRSDMGFLFGAIILMFGQFPVNLSDDLQQQKLASGCFLCCMFFGVGLKQFGVASDIAALDKALVGIWNTYGIIILFSFSGFKIPVEGLSLKAGPTICVIIISLVARAIGMYLAQMNADWDNGSKIFAILCMSPKATVQATLLSLAAAKTQQVDPSNVSALNAADTVASMGALAIILTAPTFAFAIPFFGKRLIVSQEASSIVSQETSLAPVPAKKEGVLETARLTLRASIMSHDSYGLFKGSEPQDGIGDSMGSLLSNSDNGRSISAEDVGATRGRKTSVLTRVPSGAYSTHRNTVPPARAAMISDGQNAPNLSAQPANEKPV